jgi:hypothetical protein
MARKRQNGTLEDEIDAEVATWVGITRAEDPAEWRAWTEWRRKYAGAVFDPDGLTVPTPFPPMTVKAANEYLETLKKLRRLAGHREGLKRISNDPSAWRLAAE